MRLDTAGLSKETAMLRFLKTGSGWLQDSQRGIAMERIL